MGKIAQVSSKYIIHATLKAEGIVDKPDIIGAIFGQTEGLLGKEMELRELQKTGRIGRIDVDTADKEGKTTAKIQIPSSLDKTQTAIIAAAVETIERIGPSNGKISIDKIEDVRGEKRDYIQERAKEILAKFMKSDESAEITNEVSTSIKEAEAVEIGKDKLTAGPDFEKSDEVIAVEGRADVLSLLRAGVTNVISVNGTRIPASVSELLRAKKTVTAFVDGDRGGELIAKALSQIAKVDFIAKAPDGKEVEELQSKEIIKCLRNKEPYEASEPEEKRDYSKPRVSRVGSSNSFFVKALDEVAGKKIARIYDADNKVLGEVPISDIRNVRGLGGVYAVVADSPINDTLLYFAKDNNAQVLAGTSIETRKRTRIKLITK